MGNPGRQYQANRHNAGFKVVDYLARETGSRLRQPFFKAYRKGSAGLQGHKLFLIQPLTYMNNSGIIIREILKKTATNPENLVVVYDNLDLPPGSCRFKLKGSSGGQRGLASIISALATENFMRISIGIGRPRSDISVIRHVLSEPEEAELAAMQAAIRAAALGILALLTKTPEQVMADLNRNHYETKFANHSQSKEDS